MIVDEADLQNIKPNVSFCDQLDLNSMDFLNFVIGLDEQLNVSIPETDYTKFISLDACVEYLSAALSSKEYESK